MIRINLLYLFIFVCIIYSPCSLPSIISSPSSSPSSSSSSVPLIYLKYGTLSPLSRNTNKGIFTQSTEISRSSPHSLSSLSPRLYASLTSSRSFSNTKNNNNEDRDINTNLNQWIIAFSSPSALSAFHSIPLSSLCPLSAAVPHILHYIPSSSLLIYTSYACAQEIYSSRSAMEIVNILPIQPDYRIGEEVFNTIIKEGKEQKEKTTENTMNNEYLNLEQYISSSPLPFSSSSPISPSSSTLSLSFRVVLIPLMNNNTFNLFLNEFNKDLSHYSISSSSYNIQLSSPQLFSFSVFPSSSLSLITILSHYPQVLSIESIRPLRLLNNDGSALIQGGSNHNENPTPSSLPSLYPIHTRGLRGENILIAIGDSYLDIDNCYFNDPETDVVYCEDCSSTSEMDGIVEDCSFYSDQCLDININKKHRKIHSYWAFVSDTPRRDHHHGTHVAGSAAGSASSPSAPVFSKTTAERFNGVAPVSKLIFLRLGSSVNSNSILGPLDMYADYFPFPYYQGARVFSNSWGGDKGIYTSLSGQIDQFAYDYEDMVILFAAGNNGQEEEDINQLSEESVTKNTVVVGAAHSSGDHFVDTLPLFLTAKTLDWIKNVLCYQGNLNTVLPIPEPNTFFSMINQGLVLNGGEGETFATSSVMSSFYCPRVSSMPEYLCRAQSPSGTLRDRVVVNVLRYYASGTYGGVLDGCVGSVNEAFYYSVHNTTLNFRESAMALFSSKGPVVKDQRIKPDIVTAGTMIISANSFVSPHSQCDEKALTTMQGTSMATPLTAGATALIRQYFNEGYYVKGEKDAEYGINPPSALVKGILINSAIGQLSTSSAVPGRGGGMDSIDYSPLPSLNISYHQGFGRVLLTNSLRFTDSNFDLFTYFKCKENGLIMGNKDIYTFNLLESTDIKITLVWTDPPSSLYSSIELVNNIDLYMIDSEGNKYLGNDYIYKRGTADSVNNVEQIVLSSIPLGEMKVVVEGTFLPLPNAKQSYSLIVRASAATASAPSTNTSCVYPASNIRIRGPSKAPNRWALYGVIIALCVLFAFVAVLFACRWYRLRKRAADSSSPRSDSSSPSHFTELSRGYVLGGSASPPVSLDSPPPQASLRAQLLGHENL